jgi:6-pyruvoyltetrahydropterin/6-carboxytetrahydropterin synthase
MLLPTDNPHLAVERRGEEVEVRTGSRRYVFPEQDVIVLPITNTTAEMIATWVLDRLVERFATRGGEGIRRVEVEMEESFGQAASCSRRLDD